MDQSAPRPSAARRPGTLADLDTPCLLLDRGRLDRNIARMATRCETLGVQHRPHLKTAKSAEVAARIPAARAHGATVSTVREAEYFHEHGFRDLLYAVGLVPQKLRRLGPLVASGLTLHVAVDDGHALELLTRAWPGERDRMGDRGRLSVWLEIDCGEHRCGLTPDDKRLTELAATIDRTPGLGLGGVFTHGGQSYGASDIAQLRAIAAAERDAVVHAASRLVEAGHEVPHVSLGSTPTAVHVDHLRGATELRAGVYVFGDLFQAGLGACELDDLALSVLTTVIGHRPAERRLVVDAGSLALSKDRSTAALPGPGQDAGYGLVCSLDDCRPLPGTRVVDAYQEHGMVALGPDVDADDHPVGSQIRILPNHACLTAAAHPRYHVLDERRQVVANWPRTNHW